MFAQLFLPEAEMPRGRRSHAGQARPEVTFLQWLQYSNFIGVIDICKFLFLI